MTRRKGVGGAASSKGPCLWELGLRQIQNLLQNETSMTVTSRTLTCNPSQECLMLASDFPFRSIYILVADIRRVTGQRLYDTKREELKQKIWTWNAKTAPNLLEVFHKTKENNPTTNKLLRFKVWVGTYTAHSQYSNHFLNYILTCLHSYTTIFTIVEMRLAMF
jgi:hypothetical protein